MRIINKVKQMLFFFFNIELYTPITRFKRRGGVIGKNCEIFPNVEFGSEPYLITIGNNVRITNGVRFVTHDGGMCVLRNREMLKNADLFGRIKIGNNVFIGWNTIILPNVKIGNNCIIGCGSVVTRDIPSNSVAAGCPARVIESIDEYYKKNKNKCDFTKDKSWKEKRDYLERKYRNGDN